MNKFIVCDGPGINTFLTGAASSSGVFLRLIVVFLCLRAFTFYASAFFVLNEGGSSIPS